MKTNNLIKISAFAAALSFSTAALAGDNDPSTSNITSPNIIVPYDGYLALDNTPMNGQLNLRFELYDAPTAGNLLWTEDQASLNFYNGRFSVGLGSVTPVTNVVLDAEKVYLGIKIDDGTGTYVALSGRQAIQPAPYSAWSANAADFKVAGDLRVEGSATVTAADGGDVLLRFDADEDWNVEQVGNGGNASLQLRNQTGAASDFRIRTNGSFRVQSDGATNRLSVNGASGATTIHGNGTVQNDLSVTRDLSVGRNQSIAGDLTVTGDITNLQVSGEFNAGRTSTGTSETNLVATGNSICFLTLTEYKELDGASEIATCQVTAVSGVWRLRAIIYNNVDVYVQCRARCLSW